MKTLGQQIRDSESIQQLVQRLVSEVTKISGQISGVRAPVEPLMAQGQAIIDRTGKVRGRPLYYNYVGSGAGRGPYVELADGSVKLDLINGIGIHLMGHGHPEVTAAAVRGALSDIVNQGNLQPNFEYTEFLEKLTGWASKHSRLKYGWLATCGTMANENALKICRQKRTPARMILAFRNAFAGRSTLMAELTDNPAYKDGLPDYAEILRLPFYDKKNPRSAELSLQAMKEAVGDHPEKICCFTFEPMQGEGGYNAAPREFFIPMLDFCREKKIPIWLDEVQTFSRTGYMFAFETLCIAEYVDVCTIAKTAQVGATLYTEEFNPRPGLIAGTYSGATAALSAGCEVLDILERGNFFGPKGRIQEIHQKFISGLQSLSAGSCKGKLHDPGGMGLMIAVTPFEGKKEQVEALLKKLFHRGLMAFSCGKDPVRIRFLVPAIIEDRDIDVALEIFGKAVAEGPG